MRPEHVGSSGTAAVFDPSRGLFDLSIVELEVGRVFPDEVAHRPQVHVEVQHLPRDDAMSPITHSPGVGQRPPISRVWNTRQKQYSMTHDA